MRSRAGLPCRVQPSTARLCPYVPLRARIVQEITDSGRPPLNQCNKRSQSIVNLIALLRAESAAFLYQVLTNRDRKSTRLNSSHLGISYAVFCLKKKKKK